MSMLDSFFKQRFNAAKCKTLLKLTIPRIKLLRNRREIQIRQMRKDIAKLLETGQEATARIRVEHIIREEKMMAAQDIVELFCELIVVRLPIIDAQRECPLDLKEGISSVCFAAPRCVDLPELLQVQMLFAGKYGKEFVSAATELMPECGVNRQLLELLSIHAPAPDVKLKLLKGIAEEHELDWDPSSTESELLKPHEDLLNGSTQFVTGSKVPLPEEKHLERAYTTSEAATRENTDSGEVDSDMLNFPEVPKQLVRPNKVTASAPEMLHFPASALSEADDQEEPHPSGGNNNTSHLESEEKIVEGEQFVPFISPPLQSTTSFLVRERKSPPSSSISKTKNDNKVDLQDVIAAAEAAAETAERAAAAARSAASIAQLRISELDRKNNEDVLDPSVENQFRLHKPMSDVIEKTDLDRQHSIGDPDSASTSPSHSDGRRNYTSHLPTAHPQLAVDPSSSPGHHQHQRVPSIDDETYFSYPNLFTSQVSDLSTHEQSFTDS